MRAEGGAVRAEERFRAQVANPSLSPCRSDAPAPQRETPARGGRRAGDAISGGVRAAVSPSRAIHVNSGANAVQGRV